MDVLVRLGFVEGDTTRLRERNPRSVEVALFGEPTVTQGASVIYQLDRSQQEHVPWGLWHGQDTAAQDHGPDEANADDGLP